MPSLDDIRASAVQMLTVEARQEVGRTGNAVAQFAGEIVEAMKPVYDAANRGDWPTVFLALLCAEAAKGRLESALQRFRDNAHHALNYERTERP